VIVFGKNDHMVSFGLRSQTGLACVDNVWSPFVFKNDQKPECALWFIINNYFSGRNIHIFN